ncbi:hypothetical protein DEO72_LG8g691 [Vigna unguiculata]|uniref:Uncharacterized protein n=1 Tax=Vigna unguiculata TaxID=3917 RepID=A0A4D6MMF5_VIGUN|nr:hypothetical protein DEO72_LG8g691 [Vigna unguiculata]
MFDVYHNCNNISKKRSFNAKINCEVTRKVTSIILKNPITHELSSRRPFRTRALLGFNPNPEPVNSVAFLVSCKYSTPQLSNLPLELRVPLLETHPALSPFPELSSRRPFRTRALLGFNPNPEPVNSVAFLVSCKYSTPQLSNLPLELRVPLLETHPALSPFPGESRTRPGSFAQASRTRLSEFGGGSPRPFSPKVAQATSSFIFERADNSPRREGSRLSEIPRCSCSCLVPSPRRRGNSPEPDCLA